MRESEPFCLFVCFFGFESNICHMQVTQVPLARHGKEDDKVFLYFYIHRNKVSSSAREICAWLACVRVVSVLCSLEMDNFLGCKAKKHSSTSSKQILLYILLICYKG